MSYARFSYADVYVFLSVSGYLDCCGCLLQNLDQDMQTSFIKTSEMLEHLELHKAQGHNVPDETIEALKEDAPANDVWMAKVSSGMCPDCDDAGWVQNPPPKWEPCYRCNPDGAKPRKEEPCTSPPQP